jgi:hypothetical protein
MLLLILIALGVALVVFLQRDTSDRFPASSLGEDEADLKAMALRSDDLPVGLVLRFRKSFSNEEWAGALSQNDPAAADDPDAQARKLKQLDGIQRVTNLVSAFGWEDLASSRQGRALRIVTQSTVYATEDAAKADTKRLCGLIINEKDPLQEFGVPGLGDESTGFVVTTIDRDGGSKTIDTVVCFRTGRIVHGVQQTGLDGSQDVALVIQLAARMEQHVIRTYAGEPEPIDPDPHDQG